MSDDNWPLLSFRPLRFGDVYVLWGKAVGKLMPGWFPDQLEEWRDDFRRTTPAQRVTQGMALSRFATRVAAARGDR